jgi:hypothetical protein
MFIYGIYVFVQFTDIFSIDQLLMCFIQFNPSWFSWTFLMACSVAKLKSNSNKATPCFRPFWTGNMSDRLCLCALYYGFHHILIRSTSLILLLRWLYSPVWTFASLMDFSQSCPIDLTVPRPHLRFPNCWLFLGWGRQPCTQPQIWRTRSPYLYPLETGWLSYTPRHRVPILVTFYDMHGLQWDYSVPQSPHRDN